MSRETKLGKIQITGSLFISMKSCLYAVFQTFLFQFSPFGLVNESVFQILCPHVIDKLLQKLLEHFMTVLMPWAWDRGFYVIMKSVS